MVVRVRDVVGGAGEVRDDEDAAGVVEPEVVRWLGVAVAREDDGVEVGRWDGRADTAPVGCGVRGVLVATAPGPSRPSAAVVSTSRPARSIATHATADVAPTTRAQPTTAATTARLLMSTA